jgi:hypothetical protein
MNYFPDATRAQLERIDNNIAHKGMRVQYNHECIVMVFNWLLFNLRRTCQFRNTVSVISDRIFDSFKPTIILDTILNRSVTEVAEPESFVLID